MLFTIIGIGILGVSASLILKEIKPSIAMFVSMATCILISFLVINKLKLIIENIIEFLEKISVPNGLLLTALKIIGVGYLIEFASDVAEECGLISIAHKITFAGKIFIAAMCFPYLFDLFDLVIELV